jgi:hypothetical protein
MPLDTIGNVRRELGRLYRASLSGKLESAEAARLAFILKEVRASIEAETEAQTNVLEGVVTRPVTNLQLIVVSHGAQYDPSSGKLTYPNGVTCDPPEFVPATPSPGPWDALPAPAAPAPLPERLPVIEVVPDDKIVGLDRWRRRSEDDTP